MRSKIIAVNAGIVIVITILSYVLLQTSLKEVVANPSQRKKEVAQALRAASAQLALDALRLERWLERSANSESTRNVLALGTPEARSEAATAEANRLRDAAVSEPMFAKMAPSLVLFVDAQGVAVGRNGSALMRGEQVTRDYPALAESIKLGTTGSAIWINKQRQEQMLASYAPLRSESGALVGAIVIGTPLSDERLTRTSDLTSGQTLMFALVSEGKLSIMADSAATPEEQAAATDPSVVAAARQAVSSGAVAAADNALQDRLYGAAAVDGYGKTDAVLIAALPSSLVGSVSGLLWPVLAIGGLGLVLVVAGGVLLGNYISGPISELEDGLLAIINGQSDLRFQLEHPELGGLVFRINSLLNAMMGVAEDTTDDQGRPSQGPSAQGFQDPG
ncbi:MAG: hypothetical protein EOO73_27060 [Myxococcales bacterium]|nr:MAG: hypothetical protein EOO73_27060 [Myxococcales bacterium]